MADIGAIVLYKVIKDKDLATWAKLKLAFFNQAYTTIFATIASFYDAYGHIPTFEELGTAYERSGGVLSSVASLNSLDIDADEIDIDVAVDALINSYTQDETLKLLTKFVENVSMMDTQEIKDQLSAVVMKLDEKTHTSEDIISMDNILLFNTVVDREYIRFPSGISNTLDSVLGGLYRQEIILLGGKRGAGKSIVCANFVEAQYALGHTSVYFTIEMSGRETFQRLMSIRAGVSHIQLKQDTLSDSDKLKLVKARAEMFTESDDLVAEYIEHGDVLKFEAALIKTKHLKPDNQIVIIDDRELSITSIDLHLQKLKAKFGDNFKLAVIDYLNQIVIPGNQGGMYDWTAQITVSKKLKELARKYDICIVSPYQIDDNGGTRFAKGILDSCDVAFLLDAHDKDDGTISFETTKIRGGPPLDFSNGINWETLKINPAECEKPTKKSKKEKTEAPTVVEDANDLDIPKPKPKGNQPWD
jgi:replicative DNA helicase